MVEFANSFGSEVTQTLRDIAIIGEGENALAGMSVKEDKRQKVLTLGQMIAQLNPAELRGFCAVVSNIRGIQGVCTKQDIIDVVELALEGNLINQSIAQSLKSLVDDPKIPSDNFGRQLAKLTRATCYAGINMLNPERIDATFGDNSEIKLKLDKDKFEANGYYLISPLPTKGEYRVTTDSGKEYTLSPNEVLLLGRQRTSNEVFGEVFNFGMNSCPQLPIGDHDNWSNGSILLVNTEGRIAIFDRSSLNHFTVEEKTADHQVHYSMYQSAVDRKSGMLGIAVKSDSLL